jgi:hypothetical protein
MSVFDGLPGIFKSTFGRPVVYTPIATGVALPTFTAIYTRRPIAIVLDGDAPADGDVRTLDLALTDVAAPAEGDLVTLPATVSEAAEGPFKIVPPIRPDGEGMVAVMLEHTT